MRITIKGMLILCSLAGALLMAEAMAAHSNNDSLLVTPSSLPTLAS